MNKFLRYEIKWVGAGIFFTLFSYFENKFFAKNLSQIIPHYRAFDFFGHLFLSPASVLPWGDLHEDGIVSILCQIILLNSIIYAIYGLIAFGLFKMFRHIWRQIANSRHSQNRS